ncbi:MULTISPECIES: phosphopantetheine-binding protein [unclassified Streptomyces]|uniref:phosphopantetheine-binding protein n=1 Tax=unclassified Streptomyces TaxID=2593676 RepID=UPI0036EDA50C
MDHASRRNPQEGQKSPAVPISDQNSQGSTTTDVISEIWCEVLELPEVGIEDNFFDIGGHSILLQLVRDRVQERLGKSVELIDFFNHPTVSSLARFLDGAAGTAVGTGRAAGRTRGTSRLGRRRAQLSGQDLTDARTASGDIGD